ncbi:ferrochelatase [Dermatophagoides farinae]|uniref:Ferrochelatase n=1 Tax=Dermatophagoides farinae TaxID=6954 RepID=A0A9D4NVK3_DERFA|nr:ferrochelatase [Dermatophagoides farinae]
MAIGQLRDGRIGLLAEINSVMKWTTITNSLSIHRRQMSTTATTTNNNDNDDNDGNKNVKTAILMLNMGGPKTIADVEPFLRELFLDNDIIRLPLQKWLGPFIAKRRTSKVAKKYSEIGGGSPLHDWTNRQGSLLIERLNHKRPQNGPYKYYIGFRYTSPSLAEAFEQIECDKPERVIAFSQYAQYCCNTTGSSLNQMAKYFQNEKKQNHLHQQKSSFHLSFIDRWPLNNGLINSFIELINNEIEQFPANSRDKILLLFTAHSLPLSSVNVGDTYPMEVSGTVMQIMHQLQYRYPFRLVWQSKVGPVQWQAPPTDDVIKGFIEKGHRNLLLIPISFINEHIETLHELDIEYCNELVAKLPIQMIRRCPTPNDHPLFIDGIVELIDKHIESGIDISPQLLLQCPLCNKQVCRDTRRWLQELKQQQQQQQR